MLQKLKSIDIPDIPKHRKVYGLKEQWRKKTGRRSTPCDRKQPMFNQTNNSTVFNKQKQTNIHTNKQTNKTRKGMGTSVPDLSDHFLPLPLPSVPRPPCTASLAQWSRRPPGERKISGSNPACAGIFSGSSHTSSLKIGTQVATLPGAWRYRVSAGTGRPGVSIL